MNNRLTAFWSSVLLGCAVALICGAANAKTIQTFPEDAIVGDKINIYFTCHESELDWFDDIDRTRTRLRMEAGTLRIDYYRTGETVPPSPNSCWINVHVGTLPTGTYPVKVYLHDLSDASDTAQLFHETQFTVRDIATRNGEARPEQNFSGVYWDPTRSGESITIVQSPHSNTLSMLVNAYTPQQSPFWLYFVSTKWVTPNKVEGRFYSVIGPSYLLEYSNWPGVQISQIGTGLVEIFGGYAGAGGFYEGTINGQPIRRWFRSFPM